MLSHASLNNGNTQVLEAMEWLRAPLLMLDRYDSLASPEDDCHLTLTSAYLSLQHHRRPSHSLSP